MTTIIEVIDRAVLVGLGALISGVATYVVTKSVHFHERKTQTLEKRQELIEKACIEIESYSSTIRLLLTNAVLMSKGEIGSEQFIEYIQKYDRASDNINNAKTWLRLSTTGECEILLDDYSDKVDVIADNAIHQAEQRKWVSLDEDIKASNEAKKELFTKIKHEFYSEGF